MPKFRKRTGSQKIVSARIESLDQEGRGVARIDEKVVFVQGALAGEEVMLQRYEWHKHYDVARATEIVTASPLRVEPRCPHYSMCGGCSMQHMAEPEQISYKQQTMLDMLRRIGRVEPAEVLTPLLGSHWGYRRKARLGVRHRHKKGRVLVGFRERHTNYLADLSRCAVLAPQVGDRIDVLADMLGTLEAYDKIAQVEVAVGDNITALVFRNLVPLTASDQARLCAFGEQTHFAIYLQPSTPESAYLLWPQSMDLRYDLPAYDLSIGFLPTDFIQVNASINQQMIPRALSLLDVQPTDRVLDLFCGLGNFSLPLARFAEKVVAVEGEAGLVARARENAQRNHLTNIEYHIANLASSVDDLPWMRQKYDKILLDPPRNGAHELLASIARLKVKKIVYISCAPGTLARDAGELVHKHGYRLASAGVMDMFPQTGHVESIALFERD